MWKKRDQPPEPAAQLSRVERYLAHLDALSGGQEPTFTPVSSSDAALKTVVVMTYLGLPESGMLTALTYGLSLADHPAWAHGKPELCLTVRSQDPVWGLAVGALAEQLRGECTFTYGDTINFGEPISPESAMSAFVVFAPAALDRDDFLGVHVGDDDHINIAGMYPIYQSEREFIIANGLEAFWKLDWDLYDVTREPAA